MNKRYDVIIIGSGVIGSSIAYYLSKKRNKEILTIDKQFPLASSSGATQAFVWVHNKTPTWYGELSMKSANLYPNLEKEIGDIEFKHTGGIAPFFSESDFEVALRLAERQAKVGIDIEVLDRDEVLEKEPELSPSIVGATYSKIDGNVNPFRLIESYIKAARINGAKFSFYNSVIDIINEHGRYKIKTSNGEYIANQLVLAGGPWSKSLGNLLDINIPIKQVRGQIMVTEPLQPILSHTIGGLRQMENGEILIGYSKEEVGYDLRSTLDIIQDTARMAIDFVPVLEKVNVIRCFSGIRVIPEDGFPIIGEIPGLKNCYIAVMHSGITLSPLIGLVMAELISEGESVIDLEKYSLKRFKRLG